MKIVVVGAGGLIGSAITARLAAGGHDLVAVNRRRSARREPGVEQVGLDVALADVPAWLPVLDGADAVVNAAGVFQQSAREDPTGVHEAAPAILAEACAQAGIRRLVHISAIGVDRAQPSEFSETKFNGDKALMASRTDWAILRPSVVLGAPVYGASALIRGLAALPWRPTMPDTAPVQPVQLDDLVETVVACLAPEAPARVVLELAGPDVLSFDEVVDLHRAWMGWRPARRFALPDWAAGLLYRFGDLAGALGWRPPIRSTARHEMQRGATGDPSLWMRVTGVAPLGLAEALRRRPASVQDRWFAGLYFLKPAILVVLPLFWIGTGIVSLTVGWESGVELMRVAGAGDLSGPSVAAGAAADIAVGLQMIWRRTARSGLYGALFLCAFYAVAGTLVRPDLWAEPLGPLMKIFPIALLHLVALATLEER